MSRKSPGRLRGPATPQQSFKSLEAELTRFVKSNIKDPDKALRHMQASPPSPPRAPVTVDDLISSAGRDTVRPTSDVVRPGSPVAQESLGATLAPIRVQRYSLQAAASAPGPFVASSIPESFQYTAAKTGATIVPGCPGCSHGGGPHVQ